jgi:acyl-CoA thioester hydrolase
MASKNDVSFRVRYEETDSMQTVYHANYLVWFEIGRTEFMREQGISYREMEEAGFGLVVVDARVKFRRSAHYDDLVTVRTALPAHSRLALKFEYTVHLGPDAAGPLLCEGSTILAFLDQGGRPHRMPGRYLDIIEKVSGGEKLNRRG